MVDQSPLVWIRYSGRQRTRKDVYMLHDTNAHITREDIVKDLANYDSDDCTATETEHSRSVTRVLEISNCEVLSRIEDIDYI